MGWVDTRTRAIPVRGAAGQAAIEAIVGAVVLMVVALGILQVLVVLAAASSAQADVRRAAMEAPGDGSLRSITRERVVDAGPPWLPEVTVSAHAAFR